MSRGYVSPSAPSMLFAAVAALVFALPARAQDPPPSVQVAMPIDSGLHSNDGTQPAVVLSFPVVVDGASWMRLSFAEVTLSGDVLAGTGALLRVTSLHDGAVQELNSIHVEQWRKTSAYFNGDALLVEVVALPGTGASRVVLASVTADISGGIPESICGAADDRVLSNDARQGRLLPIGCTGWLINDCNSCALTAGHCSTASLQVIEFNVPLSTATGALVHPGPNDQYSVDTSSLQTNGGLGVGNDWGYFGCFANSNTGLTPFQSQGQRYALALPPPFNATEAIRITGYGTRSAPATYNQAQETHVGPWVTNSGTTLQYATDTTGGNSGSPILHEPTGNAIGIHTHGGCTTSGGQNSGTGSNHAGLQAALGVPLGICAAGISVVGGPPTSMTIGQATNVTVQVAGSVVAGSATMHYRYQGGVFAAQTMTSAGGALYTGTLPAPVCGDTPQFYFSVQHVTCGTLTQPSGAPTSFYAASLGGGVAVDVFVDDFQTDLGWTTSFSGATSGQWQRGVPVNDAAWAYDPTSDGDGSGSCWLTQNQAGNTDVDGGSVTLTSPALDMQGGSCEVAYRYYLTLTVADSIDRLLVEMSQNGAAGPWSAVASHTTDGALGWRANSVTAAQIAAAGLSFTADMRVRFTANDSGAASIVEAGVDGFVVTRRTCAVFVNYCQSGANASLISATGSSSVAANDLVLHASNVPSFQNGLFYFSPAKMNVPFGNGRRCVASPVMRLPIVSSGAGSTLDYAVDNSAPQFAGLQAGDLLNFQAWFRDGTGLYDLSDGLQIVFVP